MTDYKLPKHMQDALDDEQEVGEQQQLQPQMTDYSEPKDDVTSDPAEEGRKRKEQERIARLEAVEQNATFLQSKIIEKQERERELLAENERLRASAVEAEKIKQEAAQYKAELEKSKPLLSQAVREVLGDETVNELEAHLRSNRGGLTKAELDEALERQKTELESKSNQERALTRQQQFSKAIATEVPEMQTLYSNPDFLDWAAEKPFGFGSVADALAEIGAGYDVSKVSVIRGWIDEYRGIQSVDKQELISGKPTGKAQPKLVKGKREMTREDVDKSSALIRAKKFDEHEKFMEQFI